MTADFTCPQCGGLLLSCGRSLFCPASPCDYAQPVGTFLKSLQTDDGKALSASNALAGGALVPPAEQSKFVSPFRNRPSLFATEYSGTRGVKEQGTCHQGERSDLTGCTPADGETSSHETKQESTPDVTISKFRAALARIKSKPVLKQIDAAKTVMAGVVKKVHAKLSARYGEKTATAVMASGQVLGWTPTVVGALFGQVISIPGATLFGAIPGVCVAEFVKQLKRVVGRGKGMEEDAVKEALAELQREYEQYLKDHAEEIKKALEDSAKQVEPSPFRERKSFDVSVKAAGMPCKRGERASVTGCIPAAKKPAAAKTPAAKPPKQDRETAARKARDNAFAVVAEMLNDPKKATPLKVRKIGESLLLLKKTDLLELGKRIAASGVTKQKIVDAIKAKVQETRRASPKTSRGKPGSKKESFGVDEARREWKEKGVRGKSFKSWFGDWEGDPASASKVIDPKTKEPQVNSPASASRVMRDGKPVVVFHGTPWDSFDEFRRDALAKGDKLLYGPGFYFTDSEAVAADYRERGSGIVDRPTATKGHLFKVYLNIRKPFDIDKDVVDAAKLPMISADGVPRFGGKVAAELTDAEWKKIFTVVKKRVRGYSVGGATQFKKNVTANSFSGGSDFVGNMLRIGGGELRDDLRAVGMSPALPLPTRKTLGGKRLSELDDAEWKKVQKAFAEVRPAWEKWSLQNPVVFRDMMMSAVTDHRGMQVPKMEALYLRDYPDFANELKKVGLNVGERAKSKLSYKELDRAGVSKTELNEYLAGQGYDGITHVGHFGARGGQKVKGADTHRVWIAFDPTQIKSDDNEGTFDPKDAKINKDMGATRAD